MHDSTTEAHRLTGLWRGMEGVVITIETMRGLSAAFSRTWLLDLTGKGVPTLQLLDERIHNQASCPLAEDS